MEKSGSNTPVRDGDHMVRLTDRTFSDLRRVAAFIGIDRLSHPERYPSLREGRAVSMNDTIHILCDNAFGQDGFQTFSRLDIE